MHTQGAWVLGSLPQTWRVLAVMSGSFDAAGFESAASGAVLSMVSVWRSRGVGVPGRIPSHRVDGVDLGPVHLHRRVHQVHERLVVSGRLCNELRGAHMA